jgi:hypothetical protein
MLVTASALIILAAGGPRLPANESVLILPVTTGAEELRPLAESATVSLSSAARALVGERAVSMADVSALVDLEKQKDLLGCTDVTCYADLLGALGARFVIRGELMPQDGSKSLVHAVLIDTHAITPASSVDRVTLSDPALVPYWTKEILKDLLGISPPPTNGYDVFVEHAVNNSGLGIVMIGDERIAWERSGLPLEIWLGEGWMAYRWQEFMESGLTRRDYIAQRNQESRSVFIAEIVMASVGAAGLAAAGALTSNSSEGSLAYNAGVGFAVTGALSLFILPMVGLVDALDIGNMTYLGSE